MSTFPRFLVVLTLTFPASLAFSEGASGKSGQPEAPGPKSEKKQLSEKDIQAALEQAAQSVGAASQIKGRILTVDPNVKAAVIDVGGKSGVVKGMRFRAFRDDAIVAQLHVVQVQPEMSVVSIEGESSALKTGDLVTNRIQDSAAPDAPQENAATPPEPAIRMPLSRVRGKILAVDTRVPNKVLVIFGLGSKHGIIAGQRMTVSRGSQWIATLVTSSVDESMSVGSVELQQIPVRVNDEVFPRSRLLQQSAQP